MLNILVGNRLLNKINNKKSALGADFCYCVH